MLGSNNDSPALLKSPNQLLKCIALNAGSAVSSFYFFARNAMFSSLFVVLEFSCRCAVNFS